VSIRVHPWLIPRERHENIRAGQQHDGQPAGLDDFVHNLFFGYCFAQCQTRAVADVQDMNFIFAHGKKDPVFVLTATVENLTDSRGSRRNEQAAERMTEIRRV
jgi:hypothetical protein